MNLESLVLPLKTEDNAFRAGLSRSIQLVQGAVQAIDTVIKSTFQWAEELDSIGDNMDTTNQKAAAYNYVLRKSGTATDTFTKGMVILGKGLVDASGKLDTTGKALKEWGIDVLDVNGSLKDQDTVIADVAKRYAEFGTQQERINFLTEVFGRSGAELVDFFDVLASEGGIDAVTKKVEDLGLAIDPGRYEQFNRNLEELKLIGLGLAVGFTEQVMPALEGLTDWVMNTGVPAFMDFKSGLITAFESGGIGEALSFIDTEVALWLDGIDWSGYGTQFGDLIEGALTNGSGEIDVPASLESLANGIQDFLISAVGEENLAAFREHFVDYILLQLDRLNNDGVNKTKTIMDGFWASHSDGLDKIKALYDGWNIATIASVVLAGASMNANMTAALISFNLLVDAKLRQVSHTFFNRATGWANQAAEGFLNNAGAVIGAVQTIVGDINAALKKIITSFRISVSWSGTVGTSGSTTVPSGGGGAGGAGGGTGGGGGGSTGGGAGRHGDKRASGGPMIKGREYDVAEFFRPERFTPNVNGRMDPLSQPQTQGVVIMNWDQLDYSRLATEIVKAEINQ